MMEKNDNPKISVVLPVYNEEKNLRHIHREISQVMRSNYDGWEIIFVDDGSTDNSYRIMKDISEEDHNVKLIKFKKNFGQSAALSGGFKHSEGDIIVTLDADLQNDPKEIPKLVDKLHEGYDCVSGWRKKRKDSLGKRFASWVQTKLAMKLGPNIHDFGCTLKAYTAKSINDINLYGENHRYIPAELHRMGYKVTELPVNHRPRKHGNTKYGSFRLLKGSFDLFFHFFWNHFSAAPIHFLGTIGFIFMVSGFALGTYRVLMKYLFGVPVLSEMAQLLLAISMVLFGFLLLMFGVLAEILMKIYYSDRDNYTIESIEKHGEHKEE